MIQPLPKRGGPEEPGFWFGCSVQTPERRHVSAAARAPEAGNAALFESASESQRQHLSKLTQSNILKR